MPSAPLPPAADRSVLRRLRKNGDESRDWRGRVSSMPPILHYGFRPFFFLAALHAMLAIPVWLWLYVSGDELAGPFRRLEWHVHEMLFGYLAAVMTGFVLTAIPNWTGRLPLSGWPLARLVLLWLGGRAACVLLVNPAATMAVDLAFPSVLAFTIWREVVAGSNWRNAPIATMVTLFGVANALHHGANFDLAPDGLGPRLALAVTATLIALIGGRIVPSFTRNWLVKSGSSALPGTFGPVDKAALAGAVLAAALWTVAPDSTAAGLLLVVAGMLLLARLGFWRGAATVREPILFILHVGYAWLGLAFLLLGISRLSDFVSESAALHALTAGAIGTMTIAVMTRASLGHTGRAITADYTTVVIYLLINAGAVLRCLAPSAVEYFIVLLTAGGVLWSLAFALFAIRYGPVLWQRA